MAATHTIAPLHLSGNTTELQNRQLQECLDDAVRKAYQAAIEQLDRQSAQAVLEVGDKLRSEIARTVIDLVRARNVWGTPTGFIYKID